MKRFGRFNKHTDRSVCILTSLVHVASVFVWTQATESCKRAGKRIFVWRAVVLRRCPDIKVY